MGIFVVWGWETERCTIGIQALWITVSGIPSASRGQLNLEKHVAPFVLGAVRDLLGFAYCLVDLVIQQHGPVCPANNPMLQRGATDPTHAGDATQGRHFP